VRRKPGLRFGYVPQKLAVDAGLPMTVARFLSLPVRQPADRITAALQRTGAAGLEGAPLAALSGGTLQRVLLARALISQPDLVILDEPTQGLDQPGEAAFYRLIEQLRAETGAAVLMVSHDLHVVMSASDRVVCLNRHVCCEGTPSHVSAAPEYRALFGQGTGGALALYRHDHDHHHHDHDGHHGEHHHREDA
jgi:zinc transport system ATP-binding protein